ncbi:MAG: hypothetical protein VX278_09585 [Myxococcota bacterium]|nr:hypothetical protein [Myxococcota bacterium]
MRLLYPLIFSCFVFFQPPTAYAHGIWGHIHVTGWAIENLPPGELRDFYADPEVFNAALFGSAFTDSGLFPLAGSLAEKSEEYAEHTHWEPFVTKFIEWIQINDPPPWNTPASRKRVAFLMGAASHGLQDEIFDSLFLHQTEENDEQGQSVVDPASDGFLAADGHIRFYPEPYIPMDALLILYQDLHHEITEDVIQTSVDMMIGLYINPDTGPDVAMSLGLQHEENLPWTRTHYLDPTVPGSLRSEIIPTMRYMEAIWKRLHQEFEAQDLVIATFPERPRRLRSEEHQKTDSWVSFMFGAGVNIETLSARWTDTQGQDVPFSLRGTRWGQQWTRIVRLQPAVDLHRGGWYHITLSQGAQSNAGVVSEDSDLWFQVDCDPSFVECPNYTIKNAAIDPTENTEDQPPVEQGCNTSSQKTSFWTLFLIFVFGWYRQNLLKKGAVRPQEDRI